MKRENFSSIDYLIHFLIHECFVSTGEIAPVGPTSFEFVVPEGSPLTISPSVGTIEPGKVPGINSRSKHQKNILLERFIK